MYFKRYFLLIPVVIFFLLWSQVAQAFFFGGVTLKDEKELGRKFDVMVRSRMPVIEDPEIKHYVENLLQTLVKAIPPQPFTFKAAVINHNALNAFAVPGGYVFVFSGMIMNLDKEEELAGVLAHELAHVTQRHVASRLERAQYLTLGALLVAVAGVALAGPAGGAAAIGASGVSQAAMLNYSRLDESEADNIGLQYLRAAGFPPAGMVGGFKILRQKSWMSGISIPTYLSTHPDIGDRVNSMSAKIAALPDKKNFVKKNENDKFQRVQTLLWARYGDPQSALRRFSKNSALDLMGQGIVYARQNRIKESEAAFSKALANNPTDPLILREAGGFHYRKGNMEEAEKLLLKAMKLDKRDYMAAFYYARLLDETGRASHASSHYQNVLREVPHEADVHEAYARSLGKTGKNYEAYIHLVYSALYSHNKKLADRYFEQAKSLAEKRTDRSKFDKLQTVYTEIKEIWDKS